METIIASLTSALGEIGTDALGVIGNVLPAALAIVGAVLVVKIGIRVFYSIAGK